MKMFNPLPIIIADYRRNRLMVVVTLLLVAISVATGITVISQERALRQGSARAADDFDLLLGSPGSPTQLVLTAIYLKPQAIPLLSGDVLDRASSARGVRYAAPIAFGDRWQGYPIVGTIADFALRGGQLQPAEGRVFQQRGEAIIGAAVKLPLGSVITPQHGMHEEDDDDEGDVHHHADAAHQALHYRIVGRLPARHNIWDSAILVPVEDVWAVHGLPIGHAPDAVAHLGPPWDAQYLPGMPAIAVKPDSIAAAYGLRTQFRTAQSQAFFPAEVLNDLYLTLGNVRDLMALLALSTQVLVVVAVLMALLVGFLARRRQYAVLRAIGASRAYVFCTVWAEVSLLILGGALGGLLLGWSGSQLLARWLATRTGFAMPVSLGMAEWLLLGGLVLAGALIAMLPAWLTFRRPIAAGLSS